MCSRCRQNYHETSEAEVNKQINLELSASYAYLSLAYHFDRDDVALPGFHKFFKKCAEEEREHAEKFMKFQNTRGGRIVLKDIKKPDYDDITSPVESMKIALNLEKKVNEALFHLHEVAVTNKDDEMADFIESNFLHEQTEGIKKLSDYITNLERVGDGLGVYQFDKLTLDGGDD
ncbi:soma ferritin-like [Xenia sp. Carnegie-2017]|uniref:soma ferritin-like n=1 Tax=Xenia sp. Carnegie-2017 TaxID=2897299 RepID=UPI001F049B41|nr:soma ferritin-like [Xenia sp. Carnegie-2017]